MTSLQVDTLFSVYPELQMSDVIFWGFEGFFFGRLIFEGASIFSRRILVMFVKLQCFCWFCTLRFAEKGIELAKFKNRPDESRIRLSPLVLAEEY